ncbi:hypothetical protein OEZ86_005712 [Tetradesmus obliquus]|nr:hypothetical protein OEZ86_005712 [Tetradesmus obliquus]
MADAFYQVPLHASAVGYFCFEFAGEFYQINCLPFGWNNWPYYFTKVTRPFVAHLRSPAHTRVPSGTMYPAAPGSRGSVAQVGCKVLPYLDDFLFVFPDQETAAAGAEWTQSIMYWLGFTPHPTKSVWEPTQRLEHLGLVVDLAQGTFCVPPAKVARLTRLARGIAIAAKQSKRRVPKRGWLHSVDMRSWGAVLPVLGDSPEGVAHGAWSAAEACMHINQQEMRAVRMALLSFEPVVRDRVVVQKVREERANVTVVVPLWPAQPWFHELMLLAVDSFQLPCSTLTGPMARRHSSWPLLAVRIEH